MPYGNSKHLPRRALRVKKQPSIPIERPLKESKKAQNTISTAPILRRKPMKEVYGKKHLRRHGRCDPQHELFLDYQDQVENSRNELLRSSHGALEDTHFDLTTSLAKLEMQDTNFYNDIEAQRQSLLAPIAEETVETSFVRDGKSLKETFQIGQRVEAFKGMVVQKKAELEHYWAEWEKVQAKIVKLASEVLGPEAFEGGSAIDPKTKMGYSREMGELDLQHEVWLEEMKAEIQLIGEEAVMKMQATEKELDVTLRKEQASFIAQVFASSD